MFYKIYIGKQNIYSFPSTNFKLSELLLVTPMNAKYNVFYDVIIKILNLNAALFILFFDIMFVTVIFARLNICVIPIKVF